MDFHGFFSCSGFATHIRLMSWSFPGLNFHRIAFPHRYSGGCVARVMSCVWGARCDVFRPERPGGCAACPSPLRSYSHPPSPQTCARVFVLRCGRILWRILNRHSRRCVVRIFVLRLGCALRCIPTVTPDDACTGVCLASTSPQTRAQVNVLRFRACAVMYSRPSLPAMRCTGISFGIVLRQSIVSDFFHAHTLRYLGCPPNGDACRRICRRTATYRTFPEPAAVLFERRIR